MPENSMDRRQVMKYAAALGLTSIAGCSGNSDGDGSGNQAESDPGSDDQTETDQGPDVPNTLASLDFISVDEPAPIDERITGAEWTPPEFDEDAVADSVKHYNLGSMKNDPATAEFHDRFNERTDITVDPIVVPSKRATPKITTVLSSRAEEPVMMQIDRQMYMDFVEPGWIEPVDQLWSEAAYEHFPQAFSTEFVTDIDVTSDEPHQYLSVAIAEGSVKNYRPDLLQELGFDADFLKRPTWEDVREVCEEADSQDVDYYGHAFYGGGVRYPSYPWMLKVWSQGERIVQDGEVIFNSDAGVEALEWQRQLIEDGLVPDVLSLGQGGPEDLFLGGEIVGYTGGSKMIPRALEQLGEAGEAYDLGLPAKYGSDGEHATFLGTDTICINRFAPPEKKKAALVYMDGCRSAEADALEFVMEGNMPANSAAWDLNIVQSEAPFQEIPKESIEKAREGLWPRQIQTIEVLVAELQAAWAGQKSPQEALDTAQAEVDGILQQN